MDARYRVVLTGELVEGHELGRAVQALSALLKQPPEKVRLVFNQRPTPLNRVMDYRGAREIQHRLETIGVRSKVEALENRAPAAFAASEPAAAVNVPAAPKGEVTCPKCAMTQPKALACGGCGIVFAKYRPDPAPVSEPVPPKHHSPTTPAPAPADPQERMLLLIGPRAERYAEKFERFKNGRFAPSWNWAAFLGGGAWAAYRKLWPWVGFSLGILALMWFAPLLSLALSIAYGVIADYTFYRHVQRQLVRLDGRPDEAVALAGGGHLGAGVAMAVVTAATPILMVGAGFFLQAQGFTLLDGAGQVSALVADDPQLAAIAGTRQGQATIAAFNTTGTAVYAWRNGGNDLNTVSTRSLIRDAQFPEQMVTDGWGTMLMVVPDSSGFIVISAGPDGSFDSDDDIPILFPAN